MRPKPEPIAQLAIDERVVTDTTLEALLERRAQVGTERSAVNAEYSEADAAARAALAVIPWEDDAPLRIGRFRIVRQRTPERAVSFVAAAGSRIRIEAQA